MRGMAALAMHQGELAMHQSELAMHQIELAMHQIELAMHQSELAMHQSELAMHQSSSSTSDDLPSDSDSPSPLLPPLMAIRALSAPPPYFLLPPSLLSDMPPPMTTLTQLYAHIITPICKDHKASFLAIPGIVHSRVRSVEGARLPSAERVLHTHPPPLIVHTCSLWAPPTGWWQRTRTRPRSRTSYRCGHIWAEYGVGVDTGMTMYQ